MIVFRAFLAGILSGFFVFCHAQVQPLSYTPIASSGSTSLDRIIMISANPNLLHIYDPVTVSDLTVTLPALPMSLSVSPNGLHAAVGHAGQVTWIDLTTASIVKTFTIPGNAGSLVLGETSVWVLDPATTLSNVNLQTGAVLGGINGQYLNWGVLNADQSELYTQAGKIAISSGQLVISSRWGVTPAGYGPSYLSIDGMRIYQPLGTVAHASSDSTVDLRYIRTLPVSYTALTESGTLKKLAVIAAPNTVPVPNLIDTNLQLFDTDYLTQAATVALVPFATAGGPAAAHGKAVFFSQDSTRLYVVVQADTASNLPNPFGVELINIATPAPCSVVFDNAPLSVSSAGAYPTLAVAASPDCFYHATASAEWIEVTAGAFGSGNGTVQWIVRPNYSTQPRTGAISINGQNYTVQQVGAPTTPSPLAQLSFNVQDAGYSKALDSIVAISGLSNELHIYAPGTRIDTTVPLVLPPLSLSVAPDGLHAAVGHDGWVSYVDLQKAIVQEILPIGATVQRLLLAGNGYIYAVTDTNPFAHPYTVSSLELATGLVKSSGTGDGIPKLTPDGKYFYLAGLALPGFSKWDITGGVAVPVRETASNFQVFESYWLYEDGSAIISDDGPIYSSSDVLFQDLQYITTYPFGLGWAAESSRLRSTAILPEGIYPRYSLLDTQVQFFGDTNLQSAGSIALPPFPTSGTTYPGYGTFAFWNSDATELYIGERADPTAMLSLTDGVYTLSLSAPSTGCNPAPAGPIATVPTAGGAGSSLIVAGSNCPWSVTTDSSWLVITAGGFGGGTANVSWSADANAGTASRTAHIAVGGRSYQVTQRGASAAPLTLSSNAMAFSGTWRSTAAILSQTFSVVSGLGPFSVTLNPGWISVTPTSSTSFSVSVDGRDLPAGTNSGAVSVTASDGQVQVISVTVSIAPALTVSPSTFSFNWGPGDPTPTATISIDDGTSSGTAFNIFATFGNFTFTPSSGTLPASVRVSPNVDTPVGVQRYSFQLGVGGKLYSLPVVITRTGSSVQIGGIADAGDFTAMSPVAPGEIVVIGGTGLGPAALASYSPKSDGGLPTTISGTSVSFDSYPAPLIYTSSNAVAAVVPYEVAGHSSAEVTVTFNGAVSVPFAQPLAPAAPHFFTTTFTSAGQIAALNQDNSVNSAQNPAAAGSIVVLYATGEGVTNPPGIDGTLVGSELTHPLADVTVTVGGEPATVFYAGGSPSLVEGLLQINVQVPAGTPPGNVPVGLTIGAASTPQFAAIAVK